ncbi:MAG: ATP-binding protein [Bdellovibrionales bacterium]
MTASPADNKDRTIIDRLIAPLTGGGRMARDKARLEAFLTAFPGEYCGFSSDNSIAYSAGFCALLNLESIASLADIQNALPPGDAAALEGYMDRLQDQNTDFILIAHTADNAKTLKISGSHGKALNDKDRFDVLWIEDITAQIKAEEDFAAQRAQKDSALTRFRQALDNLPFPCWIRGADQALLWVNNAYCAAAADTPEAIIRDQKELSLGLKTTKTGKPKDKIGRDLAAKALSSGEPQTAEAYLVIKGKRLLVGLREIPIKTAEFTIGLAEDNSENETLQSELKRHQSSNRELLEQLRTAIAIFGADHKLEFYNSSYAQLWGVEDGWLNTRPKLGDIMEKLRETRRLPEQADFKRFKQSWLDMFTALIDPHDDMLYLPDGSALRMLVIPHSMGGLMMTFEDVTSRLELESSYNTLIAVQKETLDNLAEAVAVFGGDGRLKLWNPAYGRLWDLHPEDLDGEPHITRLTDKLGSFYTKEEWPTRKEQLIALGLDRVMHEGRLKRANDTLIDFTTVPLPDGGVLVTYTDVTDSVRVENALRDKNAALEAAEQLKLDFLANVSYQLRTPLNAIMGFNEILDQEFFGTLNTRQKEYTKDIQDASNRLLELINDILDLSTLEAGYMTLQREDVKIYDLMTSIRDLVSDWARSKKIEVQMACTKNIGKISADEKRLKQAVINVIRNAINFTPDGGEIKLSAKRGKDGLEITIKDNGVGIPEEDRIRIFAPFERAQSGKHDNRLARSGAGLGLSLVKNIIALHGGTVELDSEPGKGTTARIFIPHVAIETPLKLPIQKAS